MKQLRRFRRKLAVAIGRYLQQSRIQAAKIDNNAKCPGCGHHIGYIKFSEQERKIVHYCINCDARWGEETIIPVAVWLAPE